MSNKKKAVVDALKALSEFAIAGTVPESRKAFEARGVEFDGHEFPTGVRFNFTFANAPDKDGVIFCDTTGELEIRGDLSDEAADELIALMTGVYNDIRTAEEAADDKLEFHRARIEAEGETLSRNVRTEAMMTKLGIFLRENSESSLLKADGFELLSERGIEIDQAPDGRVELVDSNTGDVYRTNTIGIGPLSEPSQFFTLDEEFRGVNFDAFVDNVMAAIDDAEREIESVNEFSEQIESGDSNLTL